MTKPECRINNENPMTKHNSNGVVIYKPRPVGRGPKKIVVSGWLHKTTPKLEYSLGGCHPGVMLDLIKRAIL